MDGQRDVLVERGELHGVHVARLIARVVVGERHVVEIERVEGDYLPELEADVEAVHEQEEAAQEGVRLESGARRRDLIAQLVASLQTQLLVEELREAFAFALLEQLLALHGELLLQLQIERICGHTLALASKQLRLHVGRGR